MAMLFYSLCCKWNVKTRTNDTATALFSGPASSQRHAAACHKEYGMALCCLAPEEHLLQPT
eukprot:scaffold41585_cov33-Tisochrysis_lutea.AAC.1